MNQSPFLIPVIIAGCLYALGQYISSQPLRSQDNFITVQATGKANSTPNIAHVTLGVQVQPQQTAQAATDMLAKQGNAVIDAVKALGIAEADIKTQNISVQPSYTYDNGKQSLRGFEANEQIEVTIRNTAQSGDVISKGTEAGANQVGGVTFKTEDVSSQQLSAEKEAIKNARKKADELADALNVRLGKVKQYNVQQNFPGPMPYALESKAMGGDASSVVPQVPVGTQENSVMVTITYEIK